MKERVERMRLEFESLSENEQFARVTAAVFMSRLDPTVEEVEDVKIAVSEAVTNAVIHGYGGGNGTIWMDATAQFGEVKRLTMCIRDAGKGIENVEKAREAMFTTDTSGQRSGMGFSFMEAFMDEVRVESEPEKGTLVTMVKQIGR